MSGVESDGRDILVTMKGGNVQNTKIQVSYWPWVVDAVTDEPIPNNLVVNIASDSESEPSSPISHDDQENVDPIA